MYPGKSYSLDNRQQLLPGYIGADLFEENGGPLNIEVTAMESIEVDSDDKQSYVWRLAPYLDNAWETFFADAGSSVISQFVIDYDAGDIDDDISERPTYGLNSIFLGGDSVHGGAAMKGQNPWTGTPPTPDEKITAVRMSEVKSPTTVIVFAPTAKAAEPGANGSPYDRIDVGFCELRPPYLDRPGNNDTGFRGARWESQQWEVGEEGQITEGIASEFVAGAGLPIDRTGGFQIPVVHLDGSNSIEHLTDLSTDMKKWSPFELAPLMRKWTGSPNDGSG